jgi:peroxiredoxin
MKLFSAFVMLLLSFVFVSAQTEQAPIQEKELNYKNWTYKNVRGNGEINLRDYTKGKKLVMVVYFAPWCPNWKHEAPFAQKMYEKYKANGFDVVGVGEYDTVEAMKTNLETFKITFPVVYESDAREAKQKTLHYEYRKAVGDTRGWGSPWNIFIQPASLEKKGNVLLKKAFIVNGELIEPEAEKFIREKLGLPAEDKKAQTAENKSIEVCEPEKKILSLKMPE